MVGIGSGIASALGAAGQIASGLMAADARQMEFADQIRILKQKRDYTTSLAASKAAASGIALGSVSTSEYLKQLTSQFNTEIAGVQRTADTVGSMDFINQVTGSFGALATVGLGVMKANNWGQ